MADVDEMRDLQYANRRNLERAQRNLKAQGYLRFEQYETGIPEKPLGMRAYKDTPPVKSLLGHLVWWSLPDTVLEVRDVAESATEAGIPAWMTAKVKGMTAKAAMRRTFDWTADGKPSARLEGENGNTSLFHTRSLGTDQILVRETLDVNGKRVDMQQMGIFSLESDEMRFDPDRWLDYDAPYSLREEAQNLFLDCRARMWEIMGKVHTNTVRTLVQQWLEQSARICLRGTGGVYFIPGTETEELLAIRNWIMSYPVEGNFSVAEMWTGGANSTEDLATAATSELQAEIDAVTAKLEEYAANAQMKDGVRAFSLGTTVKALSTTLVKLNKLEQSLGSLGVIRSMLTGVMKQAQEMAAEAKEAADATKLAKKTKPDKATVKPPLPVAEEEEAPAVIPQALAKQPLPDDDDLTVELEEVLETA